MERYFVVFASFQVTVSVLFEPLSIQTKLALPSQFIYATSTQAQFSNLIVLQLHAFLNISI
jgi:hypothetical protein